MRTDPITITRAMMVAAMVPALLLAAAVSAHATSIGVMPSTQSVVAGTDVDVAITIAGLGDATAPSLGVFDLNVDFDPTLLGLTSVDYGDPSLGDQLDLLGLGSLLFTTSGAGTVSVFELSFDPADELNARQVDQFTLVVLHFSALAGAGPGASTLHLTVNALGDADGNALAAAIRDGTINVDTTQTVPAVPEPASVLLLGPGLLGAGLLELFRRKSLRRSHAQLAPLAR